MVKLVGSTSCDPDSQQQGCSGHFRRQNVGHRVVSQGRQQRHLGQVVAFGADDIFGGSDGRDPPKEGQAERSAEVEAQGLQNAGSPKIGGVQHNRFTCRHWDRLLSLTN